MTAEKLIRIGAGLQRLQNRIVLGYKWKWMEKS